MSMAVFYGRKFIGVVGVDVNLQESWNLMRSTDYWYVFVTDEMGWTIYHPMLPVLSGYTEHPYSIRITRLEREASYNGVLLSMFRYVMLALLCAELLCGMLLCYYVECCGAAEWNVVVVLLCSVV